MRSALAPIAFLSLMSLCASSQAALGSAPSAFSGKTALKARSLAAASSAGSSAAAAAYTVNETMLDSGTVVREYVGSGDGNVFAVSWNGPFIPDLRTLLGSHFATLTSAAAARPKAGHSQLSVKDGDVVIVSGGHMRAYAGRAWIVSALPAGVSADEIE